MKLTLAVPAGISIGVTVTILAYALCATNTRPGTQRRTRNTTRMDATHTHMEERDRTVSAYQMPGLPFSVGVESSRRLNARHSMLRKPGTHVGPALGRYATSIGGLTTEG